MITCSTSLAGIKELRIGYQTNYGVDIVFPIIPTYNLSTGKISCSKSSDLIVIGGITVYAPEYNHQFSSFTEELVIDDAGRYYQRTFNFSSIYDANLQNLLDNKFVIIFLTDANNVKWVIGYDNPLKLQTYTLNSGVNADGQDNYQLIYNSKSYNKITQYEIT